MVGFNRKPTDRTDTTLGEGAEITGASTTAGFTSGVEDSPGKKHDHGTSTFQQSEDLSLVPEEAFKSVEDITRIRLLNKGCPKLLKMVDQVKYASRPRVLS